MNKKQVLAIFFLALVFITAVSARFVLAERSNPELEFLIASARKEINKQEALVNSLRKRYEAILGRKRALQQFLDEENREIKKKELSQSKSLARPEKPKPCFKPGQDLRAKERASEEARAKESAKRKTIQDEVLRQQAKVLAASLKPEAEKKKIAPAELKDLQQAKKKEESLRLQIARQEAELLQKENKIKQLLAQENSKKILEAKKQIEIEVKQQAEIEKKKNEELRLAAEKKAREEAKAKAGELKKQQQAEIEKKKNEELRVAAEKKAKEEELKAEKQEQSKFLAEQKAREQKTKEEAKAKAEALKKQQQAEIEKKKNEELRLAAQKKAQEQKAQEELSNKQKQAALVKKQEKDQELLSKKLEKERLLAVQQQQRLISERECQMRLLLEADKNAKHERYVSQLGQLLNRQNFLLEETRKLESQIYREEETLKALEQTRQDLIRKLLENS
jgi:hypothetical protein